MGSHMVTPWSLVHRGIRFGLSGKVQQEIHVGVSMVKWGGGSVLPFKLVSAYTEPNILVTAFN